VSKLAPIPVDRDDPDVTHGVVTDANGTVTLNLFQADWDSWGWWLPGPPLWIPKPMLPPPAS
jgi:hypothetical protein